MDFSKILQTILGIQPMPAKGLERAAIKMMPMKAIPKQGQPMQSNGIQSMYGMDMGRIGGAKPQQNGYRREQYSQMIPVGQKIPQEFMDSYSPETRALAQIYDTNPQDPRVMGVDPKMFGYQPDDASAPLPPFMDMGRKIGGLTREQLNRGRQLPMKQRLPMKMKPMPMMRKLPMQDFEMVLQQNRFNR